MIGRWLQLRGRARLLLLRRPYIITGLSHGSNGSVDGRHGRCENPPTNVGAGTDHMRFLSSYVNVVDLLTNDRDMCIGYGPPLYGAPAFDGGRKRMGDDTETFAFMQLFKAIATLNEEHPSEDVTGTTEDIPAPSQTNQMGPTSAPFEDRLRLAIDESDIKLLRTIWNENERRNLAEVEEPTLLSTMDCFLSEGDLATSLNILVHHAARCKADGRIPDLHLYQKFINRIRYSKLNFNAVEEIVKKLTEHIIEEYSEGKLVVFQYLLLPSLVQSLSSHDYFMINKSAKPILKYILDCNFPMVSPESNETILAKLGIRQTGIDFPPFHRLFGVLIKQGHIPEGVNTITNLVHSQFPFDDLEATHEILLAIKKLYTDDNTPTHVLNRCKIDLGSLEKISLHAARKTKFAYGELPLRLEVVLLIWDLVEQFDYEPNASLFEDIIQLFVRNKQHENALSALVEMEERLQEKPSRELIQSLAREISSDPRRLNYVHNIVTWHRNKHFHSTGTLNAVMHGFGMMRNMDMAFKVYDSFQRLGIQTDDRTYSILLESFNLSLRDVETAPKDEIFLTVQELLIDMDSTGVWRNKEFCNEHIRLLCALDRLQDAAIELEELGSDLGTRRKDGIPCGTVIMLVNRLLQSQEFKRARDVARLSEQVGCADHVPLMIRKIRERESRVGRRT